MSNTKAIEDLINGYATSEDSSFLIPNVTEDFLDQNLTYSKTYKNSSIKGNYIKFFVD